MPRYPWSRFRGKDNVTTERKLAWGTERDWTKGPSPYVVERLKRLVVVWRSNGVAEFKKQMQSYIISPLNLDVKCFWPTKNKRWKRIFPRTLKTQHSQVGLRHQPSSPDIGTLISRECRSRPWSSQVCWVCCTSHTDAIGQGQSLIVQGTSDFWL